MTITDIIAASLSALKQHRATMKRLEAFDLELRGSSIITGGHVNVGDKQIDGRITRHIADELRRRMEGEDNG